MYQERSTWPAYADPNIIYNSFTELMQNEYGIWKMHVQTENI